MILIVTNKHDYTADFLILEMKRRRVDFLRLNTEDFPNLIRLSLTVVGTQIDGVLSIGKREVALEDIDSVWYRRPLPSVPSELITDQGAREFIVSESRATLEGLWRVLDCIWVSHPDKIRVAESKLFQLQTASKIGFAIAPTVITNSPDTAQNFYDNKLDQIIVKPQSPGLIERDGQVSLLYTNVVTPDKAADFAKVGFSPVLFQRYVPKQIELRVTVVGNRVFAVEIHSQEVAETKDDWRKSDPTKLKHVPHNLPSDVVDKCLQLLESLGLLFGAIDLILTPSGDYVFLEINPNGQWAWLEQLCPEIAIRDALIEVLTK